MTAGINTLPSEIANDSSTVPASKNPNCGCATRTKIPMASKLVAKIMVFSKPIRRDSIGATNELDANAMTGIVPIKPMVLVVNPKSC